MIQNISFLIYKKKLEENTNRELHDSKIADLTDFDKIFQLTQLVLPTLPILTKFFCVISSVLHLDSTFKLNSGPRILLILSLRKE
jgi:hypothetical protein